MTADEPLPRQTRGFIVLLALLQGLLLYLADYGQRHGWWPFAELHGLVCWYTLVLAAPTAMLLSVRDLADRRFWQHAALLTLAFGALAAYAAWSATGDGGIEAQYVLGPFGVSASAALFVAIPYLQARLEHGRWCAPYVDLFEHAWQNAITLVLAGVFVGIVWGVLHLWAALFELIDIHFFKDLFAERPFAYLATGCAAGLGILIGRTQHRAVQVARQILLAIGKGLLPLLAFIALLFVVSLPFTGLDALWKTRHAAAILLSLVALTIVFVNTVYQDGTNAAPYPKPLRLVVEAALCALPVFAGLAVHAILLRTGQYGWTSERVLAFLLALVLAAYATAYAVSTLRRRTWSPTLGRVNVALSLVVIGVVVLANTPPLDPHRIGVASQLARMRAAPGKITPPDIALLRFEAGRRGVVALKTLRADPAFAAQTVLAEQIDHALRRQNRWPRDQKAAATFAKTQAEARARIAVAAGTEAPDDAWLQHLIDRQADDDSCFSKIGECVLTSLDLDGDGRGERLLCDLENANGTFCQVWTNDGGTAWKKVGDVSWHYGRPHNENIKSAIRAGKLTAERRHWADVEAGDLKAEVRD